MTKEYLQNLLKSAKYSYEKRFVVSPVNISNRNIENNKFIKEFLSLLDIYKIEYSIQNKQCSTNIRHFNNNRNWIVTDSIECIEVTEGIYPVNWNINDLLLLDKLANKSNLIFMVYHYGSRKPINR